MNNSSKKAVFVLLALLTLFAFVSTGCAKYPSSYSAIGLVTAGGSKSGTITFYEFRGTKAFKFRVESGEKIVYTAKLESGSVKLYCDMGGMKEEFASVESGEEISSVLERGYTGTVYIIVEAADKCKNGDFRFTVN